MMLFQGTPSTGFDADDIGKGLGITDFASKFSDAVSDALSPDRFQTFFIKLEDSAIKSSRVLSTGVEGYSKALEGTMLEVYRNTIKIGGEIGDTAEYMGSLHESMGTLPSIQEDVIQNAVAFSKITGISVKEVGQYVGEYARIGLGQEEGMKRLNKIYANAKKFGVDASKLTKTVNENLLKSNSYGFKGGVEGLTKMAIQAQKLGMSMSSVFQIADKALDPEKAIEMAAEMQMLGGNVGALADPFRLMYLAQNDVKGLQDEFVKAASSAAVFNEKTGEFQITGEQMRRLRAQADQLGVSYDEIAETAIRAKKEQMVMSKVPLNLNVSDETKGIISSLAEVKGGKVQIQIPGTQNMVDVANLTQTQIAEIEKMGAEAKEIDAKGTLDMKGIAERQLSAAEKQNISLREIRDAIVLMPEAKGPAKEVIDSTVNLTRAVSTTGVEQLQTQVKSLGILTTMKDYIVAGETKLGTYIYQTGPGGLKQDLIDIKNAIDSGNIIFNQDAFIPSGSAPVLMSEGEVYKGIVGDQVLMGTKLDEAFKLSAEQMKKSKTIAESLGTNIGEIGDPFKNMVKENTPKAFVQNNLPTPGLKLQEMTVTSNNNINVSGGANVSGSVEVKVNGSGINMDDPKLSSLITAKVSAMIEERLSKGWNQKQGNVVS